MSHLQTIRINNLNRHTTDIERRGSQSVSQLFAALNEAMAVACKMHKNSNNDVDDELLNKLQSRFDSALVDFSTCVDMITDLTALRHDPLQVDAMITKHNVDIDSLDEQLENS